MSLLIAKPGMLTTVQDLGRFGYRALGINPNGAMDPVALRLINTLLDNADSAPAIEMHFPAPEIVVEADCTLAVGGADMGAELNGEPVRNWSRFDCREGDRLVFTCPVAGTRAYLAAAGGFDLEKWLGSAATNLTAGLGGGRLEAGDRLRLGSPRLTGGLTLGPSVIPAYSRFPTVRVVPSGEFGLLTAISERSFETDGFTLEKDSDRMGYRLSGPQLHLLHKKELVSASVTFGTIQLLPDGQLIVLMADHQTSGGYPRLANVIYCDLPLLAQLAPGDGIGFHVVSIEQARNILLRFERDLCRLRTGVTLSN